MEIIPWKIGDPPIPEGATGIFSMSPEAYHSDPCEKPSLSASIAKKVVQQSPYHAWLAHPKLGGGVDYSSAAMDRGTLIHSMILGHDTSKFVLIEADDYRTKAAKSARDSARAEGKTPVKIADYRDAEVIAEEVHADLLHQGIALGGESEIVLLWTEEVDGAEVQCRAMLDHMMWEIGLIIDFKTCESAHPESVRRALYNFGYDIQSAAYSSAYRKLFPDMAGREDFVFAFIECLDDNSHRKSILQLYRPDGMARELGRSRWERGLRRWAECVKSGRWPAYGDGAIPLTPPGWVVRDELGERQE